VSVLFDHKQGPVRVKAEISGPLGIANVELLLDTGATSSLVNSTILTSLGYDLDSSTDRVRVTMGGGIVVCPRVVLTRLTAIDQHRVGFPVLAHALPSEAGVDGLLGLDFLRNQVLTLDFRGGLITLA
jgi:predicted aspartyl protease